MSTEASLAEAALRAAGPLLELVASAIRDGLDDKAAVRRAIAEWEPVAPPVSARIQERIERITTRTPEELSEVAHTLFDLEHSVYTTTAQKPRLAVAREIVSNHMK